MDLFALSMNKHDQQLVNPYRDDVEQVGEFNCHAMEADR